MKIESHSLTLPEGRFTCRLQSFDESDRVTLFDIYSQWRSLCDNLKKIGSRSVNLPEGLSEGAFAMAMNAPRLVSINGGAGVNSSFDCFSLSTSKRIQVKAASVLPDLTSFGPKTVWDEIYFCDFFKDGLWDGTFDIYEIPNDMIYSFPVNRTQTFSQQQKEKRRPRFSIYSGIIVREGLSPVLTVDLSQ